MNILVIDDEGRIRNMVCGQLMNMHLNAEHIDSAGSAREARKLMEDRFYDIILCDIVMPEENGIEFARWVLEKYPEVKFIFLTAYADIHYMKEAISMHSFDYVLQPVSSEELQNVVERAVCRLRIEKKNRELITQGEFYLQREETILGFRTYRYLKGENEENAYIRRLLRKYNSYGPGMSVYQPILVQIRDAGKTQSFERELTGMVYKNILDELFEAMQIKNIIVLGEEVTTLIIIQFWRKSVPVERSEIMEKIESFRILLSEMFEIQASLYCGRICEPEKLAENSSPLFGILKNNVGRECRVFDAAIDETKYSGRSLEVQIKTWRKLLEGKQFRSFRESIMFYIAKSSGRARIGAETMMQIHQAVTELVLGFLVSHQIGSEKIFDSHLSYMDYMNSWQEIDLFGEALDYVAEKLQDCFCVTGQTDPVKEIKTYVKHKLDTELTVSEIADHIGMNPEYCTKLFKKATGLTLKEYIVNEKVEAAKVLLKTTDLPITLISSHVGYGNYSNFTRSFKQVTGMTPMEYRNRE